MTRIGCGVVALLLWATAAAAQTAVATEVGGLVDAYYDLYSTKPAGDAQYRNFDTKHDQFALSMAEVWLAKASSSQSRVGFKFKLNFGPASSNVIHAFDPGGSTYQNIQEAYVSYLAPAGKGLQIDAGVFATPASAEVIEAKDNANYSRGLLFALAVPYYHSGVKLTYTPSQAVTLMGGVVNGWNNIEDNNTGKSVLGAVTLKPNSRVSVVGTYIGGPEQANTNDHWRHLFGAVVTASVTDRVTLMANYDYGRDQIGSTRVKWQGIAGYAKMRLSPKIAFTPRVEFYDDPDGFTTGTVQRLKEATATLELKADDHLQWRIEYRRDWSNTDPFVDSRHAFRRSQHSIGFGLLYSFTGRLQ